MVLAFSMCSGVGIHAGLGVAFRALIEFFFIRCEEWLSWLSCIQEPLVLDDSSPGLSPDRQICRQWWLSLDRGAYHLLTSKLPNTASLKPEHPNP